MENDKVSLQWSKDGNLSIQFYNKEVVWESQTGGRGSLLEFKAGDGKLKIRNSAGQVIWTSTGAGGHTLQLHLHRNLVLLNSNNQIIWQTNTSIPDLMTNNRTSILQGGEKPQDFMIPYNTTAKYLYLRAEGGDGGKRQVKEAWGNTRFTVNGGAGATVKANFEIGTGDNMIPPGSILRMIIGKHGETRTAQTTAGSPGGGGTAVLVKKPGTGDWHLLMVAGGGGGAYSDCCTVKRAGHQANTGENGGQGGGDGGTGGTDGSYGREGSKHEWTGTGGGGAYEDNNWDTGLAGWKGARTGSSGSYVYHRSVLPTGGSANTDGASDNYVKGAWGFGGGGNADVSGGGGGGYSGGGSGKSYYPGGGGGSYLNNTFARSKFLKANGTTSDPKNGYVEYELADTPVHFTITFKLEKNTDKCIHVRDGSGTNSANVELWDCTGSDAQKWVVNDLMIKFLPKMDKCLEIQGSTPNNGANVELWTCNSNTNAQKWVYDGVKRLVRTARNLDKCLDLVNAQIFNGNNVQIWDCKSIEAQQWLVDGATLSPTNDPVQTIHSVLNTEKCLHIKDGEPADKANIELWDCTGTTAQQWYFSGSRIKANGNHGKCMSVEATYLFENGTNLTLYDCNSVNDQNWVYDGMTQSIRSGRNLNKCIQIAHSSTANAANAELWDCNGSKAQQFLIE